MLATQYTKVYQAEVVAMGGEIASSKRTRRLEWYQADLIFPEYQEIALDIMAEERLNDMNNAALDELGRRAAR